MIKIKYFMLAVAFLVALLDLVVVIYCAINGLWMYALSNFITFVAFVVIMRTILMKE